MNPKVLIAGGGIGGLAAALACARAGLAVQLFEKTTEFEPIGAGIQLGPNVTRILRAWGLDTALKTYAEFPGQLCVRDSESGQSLGQLRLGDAALRRYGAPYATVHRADLHALLLQALAQYPTVTIHRGAVVESFTDRDAPDEGVEVALSGLALPLAAAAGDVLIGADGLWSKVRGQLLNDGAPLPTGHVALRALVAQDDLPLTIQTRDITVWLGHNMHVVTYPVQHPTREGEWLNVVVILEGTLAQAAEGWSHTFENRNLLNALENKHIQLQNLLQSTLHWQAWHLHRRPPMASAADHARGRVALLGDAAHPMLPYLAQGAGMAIEDAAELGACLAKHASNGQHVSAALQHYARARWQRNARVQRRSLRNAKIFHATGLTRWGRNVGMALLGERLLDVPWLYGGST